jgi:NAD+ kinase
VSQPRPDVFVIQKQTAIERYTKRNLNIDFFEYLERDGQNVTRLAEAHNMHLEARHTLVKALDSAGVSYEMHNLDDLQSGAFPLFDGTAGSGLQPNKKLVISLGGDGTLLHASHFCGNDIALLGINSCPVHSVGHLCAVLPTNIETSLTAALNQSLPFHTVNRLRIEALENKKHIPFALNDILFCHKHPAATSRYQITLNSLNTSLHQSEKQHSSGVWISTPAGATAAIRSYGLQEPSLTSRQFLFAVRELYAASGHSYSLLRQTLDGKDHEISFFCRMRQGMVCVDGPDSSFPVGFGETIRISMPECAQLKIALPPAQSRQASQEIS